MVLIEFWQHHCFRCYHALHGNEKDGCEHCAAMDEKEARESRHRNLPTIHEAFRKAVTEAWGAYETVKRRD